MIISKGKSDGFGVKAQFIDEDAFLIFGDGTVLKNGSAFKTIPNGAIDAATFNNQIIILSDNGQIESIDANGNSTPINTEIKGYCDTLVINHSRGLFCVLSSRKAFIFNLDKSVWFEFSPPMNPLCAAFDNSGNNIAIGHGAGITIYDLIGNESPLQLKAEGGVIAASFSPETAFLVAATGAPSLVGWRLFDGTGFKMAGYPSKANSFAWINDAPLLITSGGPVGVIWPFFGMSGPMGKNAETIDTRVGIVSAVAAHGNKILLGFSDGGVDFADYSNQTHKHLMGTRPRNDAEIDLRSGTSRIVSLGFSKSGKKGAYVAEDGKWAIARV